MLAKLFKCLSIQFYEMTKSYFIIVILQKRQLHLNFLFICNEILYLLYLKYFFIQY